jgi:hypothetical protein
MVSGAVHRPVRQLSPQSGSVVGVHGHRRRVMFPPGIAAPAGSPPPASGADPDVPSPRKVTLDLPRLSNVLQTRHRLVYEPHGLPGACLRGSS